MFIFLALPTHVKQSLSILENCIHLYYLFNYFLLNVFLVLWLMLCFIDISHWNFLLFSLESVLQLRRKQFEAFFVLNIN